MGFIISSLTSVNFCKSKSQIHLHVLAIGKKLSFLTYVKQVAHSSFNLQYTTVYGLSILEQIFLHGKSECYASETSSYQQTCNTLTNQSYAFIYFD